MTIHTCSAFIFLGMFAASLARGDGLSNPLDFSLDMVSTNHAALSSSSMTTVPTNCNSLVLETMFLSGDEFYPEILSKCEMNWKNESTEASILFVLNEFSDSTSSLCWLTNAIYGTSMMESDFTCHYTRFQSIPDICIGWIDDPSGTGQSSLSSVMIVRGNLVGVASGEQGTNLLQVASMIMDAAFSGTCLTP